MWPSSFLRKQCLPSSFWMVCFFNLDSGKLLTIKPGLGGSILVFSVFCTLLIVCGIKIMFFLIKNPFCPIRVLRNRIVIMQVVQKCFIRHFFYGYFFLGAVSVQDFSVMDKDLCWLLSFKNIFQITDEVLKQMKPINDLDVIRQYFTDSTSVSAGTIPSHDSDFLMMLQPLF